MQILHQCLSGHLCNKAVTFGYLHMVPDSSQSQIKNGGSLSRSRRTRDQKETSNLPSIRTLRTGGVPGR